MFNTTLEELELWVEKLLTFDSEIDSIWHKGCFFYGGHGLNTSIEGLDFGGDFQMLGWAQPNKPLPQLLGWLFFCLNYVLYILLTHGKWAARC